MRKTFHQVSLYLRRKLDAFYSDPKAVYDTKWLHSHLDMLNIPSQPTCFLNASTTEEHWVMVSMRTPEGEPGYTFYSGDQACSLQNVLKRAQIVASELGSTAKGPDAVTLIQSTPLKQLHRCFASMERFTLWRSVEILFTIRPATPISILNQHSPAGPVSWIMYSRICGKVIEQLTNNYFHQTVDAVHSVPLHPYCREEIARQIFHILLQKWLHLTQPFRPVNIA